MDNLNRLVLIGNGFDLAHGLKTTYKDFLDWYICKSVEEFRLKSSFKDDFIEIKNKSSFTISYGKDYKPPETLEQALTRIIPSYHSLTYFSSFFQTLLQFYKNNNWVDIERYYYKVLKSHFFRSGALKDINESKKLNNSFDFLIAQLSKYIDTVNNLIQDIPELKIKRHKLEKVFNTATKDSDIKFLNFNYTETLRLKYHATEEEIIHIHGRVSEIYRNPIIFGYGDESDPDYQKIEDSGENIYLEHIKSFGYFITNNYHRLLSYIDSKPFVVYIVGHSCGLSDRVLLNTIFEHKNCEKIEIFYHVRDDGTDNFKEITQEISRHFKPHNKDLLRRRVSNKDAENIIPQNKL